MRILRGLRLVSAVVLCALGSGVVGSYVPVVHAARAFYVAPNGSPSNDGSASRPLDLATAISAQGPVRPGDTVYLRGGEYRRPAVVDSNGNAFVYYSNLTGTASAPITVRQYPGERAVLDGNLAPTVPVLVVEGSYVTYWGFEITNTSLNRYNGRGTGLDIYGHHNKFINLVIHDVGSGVGFWATSIANDSELYGSIIYNVGWEGTDRGHGHSVYVQNTAGYKKLNDNIMFNGFSFGIHAYASSGRNDYLEMRGNILFGHGNVSNSGAKANLLLNADLPSLSPQISDNYSYYAANSYGRGLEVGPCQNGTITGNYVAYTTPLKVYQCSSTLITDNTLIGTVDATLRTTYLNNQYLSAGTGVTVGVRPNLYEPGRSHVAVFNWDRRSQVTVDLTGTGLNPGDAFEVLDVQNLHGAPVFRGTYQGPVTLPMTGLTIAPPIGAVPVRLVHTAPEFAAFLVRRVGTVAGQPSIGSFAANPATIAPGQATTLSWSTSSATTVSIDGLGTVAASGTRVVAPAATTTYTLTASNSAGAVSQVVTVLVAQAASPDGTTVPPASQIVDATGAVWTIGSGNAILRNGAAAAGGSGSKILLSGGVIYVLGGDNSWWKWTGSGWSNIGSTAPGGTTTPPTTGTSVDGTTVPPAANIVDASGAVWTIGSASAILRNGASTGGSGSKLLWKDGAVYTLGGDNNWWRWSGSGWTNVGPTQPGGTATTPVQGGVSAEGTTVPPAAQIVDATGAIWTIGASNAILRNGVQAAGGSGSKLLWTGGAVYALGGTTWWKWQGSGWVNVGATQPGTTATPTASPNGTTVPPATQITDASGGVWTIDGARRILRNGVQAAGGVGSKILWTSGTIYVLGDDGRTWWRWSGAGWVSAGTTQPV